MRISMVPFYLILLYLCFVESVDSEMKLSSASDEAKKDKATGDDTDMDRRLEEVVGRKIEFIKDEIKREIGRRERNRPFKEKRAKYDKLEPDEHAASVNVNDRRENPEYVDKEEDRNSKASRQVESKRDALVEELNRMKKITKNNSCQRNFLFIPEKEIMNEPALRPVKRLIRKRNVDHKGSASKVRQGRLKRSCLLQKRRRRQNLRLNSDQTSIYAGSFPKSPQTVNNNNNGALWRFKRI